MVNAEDAIRWSEVLEPDVIESDLSPFLDYMTVEGQGTTIHNYLAENYDLEGTMWEEELVFEGETIRYDCYDGEFVYEFKTKSVLNERYLPEADDMEQLQEYLEATDSELGFLVYISRENFDVEEFPVLKDL